MPTYIAACFLWQEKPRRLTRYQDPFLDTLGSLLVVRDIVVTPKLLIAID